jgi:hypothetical protein
MDTSAFLTPRPGTVLQDLAGFPPHMSVLRRAFDPQVLFFLTQYSTEQIKVVKHVSLKIDPLAHKLHKLMGD